MNKKMTILLFSILIIFAIIIAQQVDKNIGEKKQEEIRREESRREEIREREEARQLELKKKEIPGKYVYDSNNYILLKEDNTCEIRFETYGAFAQMDVKKGKWEIVDSSNSEGINILTTTRLDQIKAPPRVIANVRNNTFELYYEIINGKIVNGMRTYIKE